MKVFSILILGLCLVKIVSLNKQNKIRSYSIFNYIYLKTFLKKLKIDQELVAVSDTSKTTDANCTSLFS